MPGGRSQMPRRFRLLVFDWDGTLVDSTGVIAGAIQQACRDREHYLARDADIPLFDGAREMLAALEARGHLLAVATGKSRVGLARALAHQGLEHRFFASRCADEGFPKPHPDMLLRLIECCGVEASETLMIGDTCHDVELAHNAGASALAVTYGAHGADGLV